MTQEATGSAESAVAEIEVLAKEGHSFPPPDDFKAQALITDDSLHRAAEQDFEGFWLDQAKQLVEWFKEPTKSLEWDPPHCTWCSAGSRPIRLPSAWTPPARA